jgi:hypothetical protein
MSRNLYYRLLFLAAAVWNWGAALVSVLVLTDPRCRTLLGIAAPADRLSIHLFALSVAVFGLGFYWVFQDITANRGLVKLAAIGKPVVFLLFFAHAWLGSIPFRLALPALGDLIQGLLFVEFLLYTQRSGATTKNQNPPRRHGVTEEN